MTQKIAICAPSNNFAMFSQLRPVSTIGKKLVKQQYLVQMFPEYAERRRTKLNG